MIAVIKGDIVGSRNLKDQEIWMRPFKELLSSWGKSPENWKVEWGDAFQL